MAVTYIPEIREENYAAFRNILQGHLPESYEGWITLSTRLRDDCASRGVEVVLVTVTPDTFSAAVVATECDANAAGLVKFARAIATRPADDEVSASEAA